MVVQATQDLSFLLIDSYKGRNHSKLHTQKRWSPRASPRHHLKDSEGDKLPLLAKSKHKNFLQTENICSKWTYKPLQYFQFSHFEPG